MVKSNRWKSKIVYCKNEVRIPKYPNVSFDCLGYTFRPRVSMNSRSHRLFTSFSPEIRKKSLKIHETICSWRLSGKTMMSFSQLARFVNPYIRGWINYYAKYNKIEFRKVMRTLNESLGRWMKRKYKRLGCFGAAMRALALTALKQPWLFVHWVYGYRLYVKIVNWIN